MLSKLLFMGWLKRLSKTKPGTDDVSLNERESVIEKTNAMDTRNKLIVFCSSATPHLHREALGRRAPPRLMPVIGSPATLKTEVKKIFKKGTVTIL